MSKNIVLCSDGTGNRGGKGHGTNVWRIYRAVDQHDAPKTQIAFYDDGVGTEDNKYLRILGGATGWGFTRNVKDLYKFLVRNYEIGDDIYMFGFSRGAYTVRALAAFVSYCGVIPNALDMSETELDHRIDELIGDFASRPDSAGSNANVLVKALRSLVVGTFVTRKQTVRSIKGHKKPRKIKMIERVPIKCVGVWDTVSAIGVPFDTGLKRLIHAFFKFNFRDRQLSDNVDYGFQALSIDDERKSFHPVVWDQRKDSANDVVQVWFAGVHSNVGGSYPKQGMAYVALDWMMQMVEHDLMDRQKMETNLGLHFYKGLRDEARHYANVHDKHYDSRAGVAALYRYAPRDIAKLMQNAPVVIHDSVFDRIRRRTLGYSPGNLLIDQPVVAESERRQPQNTPGSNGAQVGSTANGKAASSVKNITQQPHDAGNWVAARKALQFVFIMLAIALAGMIAKFAAEQFWPEARTPLYIIDAVVFLIIASIVIDARSWITNKTAALVTQLSAGIAFIVFILVEVVPNSVTAYSANWPKAVQTFVQFLITMSDTIHSETAVSTFLRFVGANPVIAVIVIALLAVIWWLRGFFRRKLIAIYERAWALLPFGQATAPAAGVSAAE